MKKTTFLLLIVSGLLFFLAFLSCQIPANIDDENKKESSNSNLSNFFLSWGGGGISYSPVFSSDITDYTCNILRTVSDVTVTPTKQNAKASIHINLNTSSWIEVISGTPSSSMSLNLGLNTLNIRVT